MLNNQITRFSRKNRKDIKMSSNNSKTNGLFSLIDDFIKSIWRINDEEYDYIIENVSDEDMKLFSLVDEKITISELKIIIKKVNELVFNYQNRLLLERDSKLNSIIKYN